MIHIETPASLIALALLDPFFGSPMVIVACVSELVSSCVLLTRLVRFAFVVRASLPMVPFGSGEAYFP